MNVRSVLFGHVWRETPESGLFRRLLAGFLVMGTCLSSSAQEPRPCPVVDLEDLPAGARYMPGDSFTSGGINISVESFFFAPDCIMNPFSGGFAEVQSGGVAAGSGQELAVNNVNLRFNFGGPVQDPTLRYGELGGNLNLEINGACQNFENFADIHGMSIGGVTVTALDSGTAGNSSGELSLSGVVTSLRLGGQELWIDDICRVSPALNDQVAGDCNQDGVRDVSDLSCYVRRLFPGFVLLDPTPPASPCATGAGDLAVLDVNGDGAVTTSDIVDLARYLFGAGVPPAAGEGCFEIAASMCSRNPGCL